MQLMPRVKPNLTEPNSKAAVSFSDVAGVEDAKAELQEVVDFLRDPKRFARLGARVPKGLLLYGPPGTGKTLLAKAVAHESGASFYSQSASAFVEMFAGLGASRIRKLFATARKNAPAIIFIDELDAVGAARTGHGFNREQDQTLNQLLVELDGFATTDQVVVMGASNRIQDLDPALLRPGRFDRQLLVAPPDLDGREKILGVHTRGKPLADDVDLQAIARQTAGLAGADLANICNEAAIFAGRRNLDRIGQAEFDAATERVVAGLQQRRVVSEKEKRILAYHEAGHALMSYLMGEALPVQKVTIVSRGNALGYTLNLPTEDRYLHTKEELIDMMKVFLAGRAAEQVVFGRVTNGAANDLEKATGLARAMVFEYGMGEVVSSRTMRADNYALSEETKRLRDAEQARLTDEAFQEAIRLITKHRAYLDQLAAMLLEKETLNKLELDAMLAGIEPESRASETVGTVRAIG
jgi:cell division protease FtsH